MTALLMSSDDHVNLGGRRPPHRPADQRLGKDFAEASDDNSPVPPAAAERSKSWMARFIEAMTKPVEGNYDNP
jgi:hypothetical protein